MKRSGTMHGVTMNVRSETGHLLLTERVFNDVANQRRPSLVHPEEESKSGLFRVFRLLQRNAGKRADLPSFVKSASSSSLSCENPIPLDQFVSSSGSQP